MNIFAAKALCQAGKSLLPSGIVAIEGQFSVGAMVNILDPNKNRIAQGLVNFNHKEINRIKGHHSRDIQTILQELRDSEVIHRNNLLLIHD